MTRRTGCTHGICCLVAFWAGCVTGSISGWGRLVPSFDAAGKDWVRLGRAILNRRVELGYETREKFASNLGMSARLLGDVENAKRSSYGPATLVRVERALSWEPGSCHAILDGAEPTPLARGTSAGSAPAEGADGVLPDLTAGIYRHYKGHHYLVLGYAHDANQEDRRVVVYVGLQLDGARRPERISVRSVDDFFARVDPWSGELAPADSAGVQRFRYVGPVMGV